MGDEGGGCDAVFVDVRNHGVVLGQQGEDERRRARGQVVECVEGKGPQDEREEERREDGGEEVREDYERLGIWSAIVVFPHALAIDAPLGERENAYSIFPAPPEPLDDPHVIDGHRGEQHLGGVRVA